MTKSDFIYGLKACGCLYKDNQTWYEHEELVKCFEDLGLIKEDKEQNNSDIYTFHCAPKDVICETIGAIPIEKLEIICDMDTIRTELKALAKSTDYNPQYVNGIMNSLYIIDKYTKGK